MKKLTLTITVVLGLSLKVLANSNQGGGLFQRGAVADEVFYGAGGIGERSGMMPVLPGHNSNTNEDANGPLGGGGAVLLSLGAAYAATKRRKNE